MLPSSVRIFVCMVPQDMRRSFDSLALVARELLGEDPQSGALYIFIGKRPTRIKALWWDRNGYWIPSSFRTGKAGSMAVHPLPLGPSALTPVPCGASHHGCGGLSVRIEKSQWRGRSKPAHGLQPRTRCKRDGWRSCHSRC
jgi:IS66 Orf2 like protein